LVKAVNYVFKDNVAFAVGLIFELEGELEIGDRPEGLGIKEVTIKDSLIALI